MREDDQAAAMLASIVLRANDREIEAMTLEAIANDPETSDLDASVKDASQSEARAGAFGMEVAGALIVPILIEAGRQFWKAYSEKLMEKAGEDVAGWTISKFKDWFLGAESAEKSKVQDQLADKIRSVGQERGMSSDDIEAILATLSPESLSKALVATG